MTTPRLEQLRVKRAVVQDEIICVGEKEFRTAGDNEHFERLTRQHDKLTAEIVTLEERAQRIDEIKAKTYREIHGMPGVETRVDVTGLQPAQTAALRSLDRAATHFRGSTAAEVQDELIRNDVHYAAEFEVHSRSEYASAFHKLMTIGDPTAASFAMSDLERGAIYDSMVVRAQAEGVSTSGGYAVPVALDPTIILSDGESDNPFLQIARTVTVGTSQWKGVSSAAVSWSFDDEAEEVSDDTITVAQPSVTVHTARGFVPFSIEIQQDWSGFAAEMAKVLAEGYEELRLSAFSTGSGTGEPRGILTALDANTNVEVVSTTDGAFAVEDLYKVWEQLPVKFRRKASWMMDTTVMGKIRQFGTASLFHANTVALPAGAVELLFGRPVYANDYFPDHSTTTGAHNRLVVGDFSHYVIAQRSGMTIEVVPHLLHTSANRPTGQRGYFAWARVGANSVLDTAFRLLQNQ